MKNLCFFIVFLSYCYIRAQPQAYVVNPDHVAFQNDDGSLFPDESSHWVPGSMQFWTDNTYNTSSLLTPMSLALSDPDQYLGLDIESLIFHKNQSGFFEEIVRLDYDGLNFVNGASWQAMDFYIRGNGGQVDLYNGLNGNYIVRLGSTASNSSRGNLALYGPNGNFRQYHTVSTNNMGYSYWYGENGLKNAYVGAYTGSTNTGVVSIYDQAEIEQAGMYINVLGQGIVWGDLKNFSMSHPSKPDTEIWYASLEGPEAGAYERGTATLQNGEAFVPYSEHYQIVANPQTMTVSLTPHEWDTYGLAVVEKTDLGFKVKELKGGQGHFSFDWEVKCVRKGHEKYEVFRAKEKNMVPHPATEEDPVAHRAKRAKINSRMGQELHMTHEGCVLKKSQK